MPNSAAIPIPDPDILHELDNRGVSEARHFTTSNGLLGVLSAGKLLSREHVKAEDLVSLIQINNCYTRWDREWFGHVSLSVQRINGHLYGISSGSWHAGSDGLWWAVLGFDREVLAHPGVVFTTTNNGYWSVVKRGEGLAGLQAMFAPSVTTFSHGPKVLTRKAQAPSQTTDPEAEALYPEAVRTTWLRTIYVPTSDHADSVYAWLDLMDHKDVQVRCDPEAFA